MKSNLIEIPRNWKKYKVKYLIDNNKYYQVGDGDHGSIKPEMYQEQGIPYIRVQNLSWEGKLKLDKIVYLSNEVQEKNLKSRLLPDDILIAKTGATIGKVGIIPEYIMEANTTSSVGKLSVDKKRFSPKYVLYSFISKPFQEMLWLDATQKSAQPGFNIDDLINYSIYSPPLPEQEKIVAFLDYKTERIDLLLKLKEEKIELLKQKRTALINEAVTKGINPDAPLKDSGIEWIGEIPEHWMLPPLATVAANEQYSFTGGPFGSDLKSEEYTDEGIRIIQLQNIGVGEFLNSYKIYTTEKKANDLLSCNIYPGEIIIAKMAEPVARACLMPDFDERYLMASDGIRLNPNSSKYDSQFLVYSINADYFRIQAELESTGSTRLRIGLTTLKKLRIIAPPLDEQTQIVNYLNQHTQEIDALIKLEEENIAALKDYRVALISEAVTGKIDVRDWQAPKTN